MRQGRHVSLIILVHIRFRVAGSRPNPALVNIVARAIWRKMLDNSLFTRRVAAKMTNGSVSLCVTLTLTETPLERVEDVSEVVLVAVIMGVNEMEVVALPTLLFPPDSRGRGPSKNISKGVTKTLRQRRTSPLSSIPTKQKYVNERKQLWFIYWD